MEPLLCYPDPPAVQLASALDAASYPWEAVGDAEAAKRSEPDDGWAGAIVSAVEDPDGAFALCRSLRKRDAPLAPLLLVVGARNSSNSNRLREVGAQIQVPSYLLQDADELDARWLEGKFCVGLSAGASTPEVLVQNLLARLRELGALAVREAEGPAESVTFRLPAGLQRAATGNQGEGRPGRSDPGG